MANPTLDSAVIVQSGSMLRDDNDMPVAGFGLRISNSKTFTTTGTVSVPIFSITGTVNVLGIWGVVTTVLGNHTAAYWRLNDGSNTPAITLSTGTTLTAKPVGSTIVKKGLAAAALTLLDATTSIISEPTTLETDYFSEFTAVQLTGSVTTNIEYVYTTSDNPTTGAIQFFVQYMPLSQGAKITTI